MKKSILLLLVISSFAVHAQQSLKDLLYSGKLKNDPGVIRKGDDLSAWLKTETTANVMAPTNTTTTTNTATEMNSTRTETTSVATDPAKKEVANESTAVTGSTDNSTAVSTPEVSISSKNSAAAKSNTAIWKDYMTTITNTLKTEVLPSKKIKKDTYNVLVSYSIATDGQTTVTDVFVSPENEFLQQQIKDRLAQDTPRLAPTLSDSGVPRKSNKKYNFNVTKE